MANQALGSRGLALLVAAALSISACETSGSGEPVTNADTQVSEDELSPAQHRLRERKTAFEDTVWEGALIGAGVGALLGALFSEDKTTGAILGGIGGAIAGSLAGKYIADKQSQYADREDQLDAMILDVRNKNGEAEALIESIEEVVAEDKRRLVLLNQQFAQKQISETDYQQQLAIVRSDREAMRDAIGSADEQLTTFRDAKEIYAEQNADVDTHELDQEIGVLQAHIATMHGFVAELSAPELG